MTGCVYYKYLYNCTYVVEFCYLTQYAFKGEF